MRVWFEDTDFSGVVYHARYLHFMERARSDLLARLGIDQRQSFLDGAGVYAVANLAIRYLRPAHMGEALLVRSTLSALRAADLVLVQRIARGAELLTDAEVRVAFLKDGRPCRQPAPWRARMAALLSGGAAERD